MIRVSETRTVRHAVIAESFRFGRLLTVRWMALIAIAVFAVMGVAKTLGGPGESSGSVVRDATFGADTAPVLVGLAALVFVAGDLGSGSVGTTLSSGVPWRTVVVAKLIVVVALGLAFAAAAVLAALGCAALVAGRSEVPIDVRPEQWLAASIGILVLGWCLSCLGAGIGFLTAGTASAVLVYIGVLFVLPLVAAILGLWLPGLGGVLVELSPVTLSTRIVADPRWHDVGTFAVFDIAVLALGIARVTRMRLR